MAMRRDWPTPQPLDSLSQALRKRLRKHGFLDALVGSETLMDHFVVNKVADDVPTYLMNHSDPSGHGFLALGRRPISMHGHVAENTQGS